jgi:hypothetical protein
LVYWICDIKVTLRVFPATVFFGHTKMSRKTTFHAKNDRREAMWHQNQKEAFLKESFFYRFSYDSSISSSLQNFLWTCSDSTRDFFILFLSNGHFDTVWYSFHDLVTMLGQRLV